MNEYKYVKSGISIKEVPFIEMIRLDSDIYSKLSETEIKYNQDTENFDTVIFYSENPLDNADQQKLIDYVQNWSEMNMQCQLYNMRQAYQDERLKKGRDITSRISVLNQYSGKSISVLYQIYQPAPNGDLELLNIIDSGAFEMAYISVAKMQKGVEGGQGNPRWSLDELKMVKAWISWELDPAMTAELQAGVDAGVF